MVEKGDKEEETTDRVSRAIKNVVCTVALEQRNLPDQVCVVIYDEPTHTKFASVVNIQYSEENTQVAFIGRKVDPIPPHESLTDIANDLIVGDMPLVCDTNIAAELVQETTTWRERDGYSLQGTPKGVVEMYRPFRNKSWQIVIE